VDHILPVEAMPTKLLEYATHLTAHRDPDGPADLGAAGGAHLPTIYALLRRHTGHDFSQYKETTIQRRVQRRMQALQLATVSTYVERLRHDPHEVEFLFKDLLIGVTHFFRDPEAFAALARTVIPQLFTDKGAADRVRVGVSGCASGEEAYSLAILLREHMDTLAVVPHVQLFATDLDALALETARRGIYPVGIAEHVSPERLQRFFVQQDHTYQVKPELRELCLFAAHSLIKDPPFSRLDLIVCRNVLIYLGPDLQQQLMGLFHYALRPGGYLFLGPAESIAGQHDLFRPLDQPHRIFQKTGRVPHALIPFPPTDVRWPASPGAAAAPAHPGAARQLDQRLEHTILEHYAPAGVMCTAQGTVVYVSGRTGRYLEPAAGVPDGNLLSMARAGLRPRLRTALHQAVTTHQRVVQERVQVQSNGGVQSITLIVEPLPDSDDTPPVYGALPGGGRRRGRRAGRAGDPATHPGGGAPARLGARAAGHPRERLSTTIEELETTNEELSSANEEFHSANEELETSKEELQSVNEELETVNAELRRKIEALDRANSDLQNLLDSTQIATLFLDTALHITQFTPAISAVVPLRPSDRGRPLADLAPRFVDVNLVREAEDVLRTLGWRERSLRTRDGDRRYLLRLGPYRTVANVIDGVVLTFTDVTAVQQAEEAARAAQVYAERVVETVRTPLLVLDADLRVRSANRAFYTLFHVTPAETEGRRLAALGTGQWDLPAVHRQLAAVLAQHQGFEEVEVEQNFPTIGPKTMLLNAREIPGVAPAPARILLAIEDITVRTQAAQALAQAHTDLEQQVEERTTALQHEITERQRLEREAQRAEHFALLGRLAAGVSHEIRNPLAAVFLQVDILAEELQDPTPDSPAAMADTLADIKMQLARLEDLVQDYLSLVRVGSLQPTAQDLGAAVATWATEWQGLAAAGGVTLHLEGLATLGLVAFHAATLHRALLNLVQNALDAMPQGGSLTLVGQGTATQVQVQVHDTGSGIPAARLEQIFAPLYTTKPGGTGLGLYIVREIVAAHGGQLTVQSVEGHGSTFTLTLPRPARAASGPDGAEGTRDAGMRLRRDS
jgi:two-component system, chemotaxis family, CheB/CheR fusion protein